MTDCKHPRGEGCAFCPDCGACMAPQYDMLKCLRQWKANRPHGPSSYSEVGYRLVAMLDDWIPWVERKIAEENVAKVHMEPSPHILITQDQADAITKALAEKRL